MQRILNYADVIFSVCDQLLHCQPCACRCDYWTLRHSVPIPGGSSSKMELTRFHVPFLSFFPGKKKPPTFWTKFNFISTLLPALCFISKDKRIYFCPFLFKVKSQINIHCQAGDKYRKRYSQIENVLLYEILHCMSLNNFEYKFVLRNWYDSLWRILKIFPKTSLTSSGWK